MSKTIINLTLVLAFWVLLHCASAEFRSAKDMQKECRVALKVMDGSADKNFENVLFAGECVGYVQGAADASRGLADNVSWYKVCAPENV